MSNTYAARARKRGLLGGPVQINMTDDNTKKQALNTLAQTGLDLVIGGLAGGYLGSIMGKHSLWAGVLVTGASYYFFGNRLGATLGVGMMASGYFDDSGVSGLGNLSTKEKIKQRSQTFFKGLKSRLFLDKLQSKKNSSSATADTGTTNGLGNVRYFVYPEEQVRGPGDIDLSPLDKFKAEVEQSGEQYQAQMNGTLAGGLGELLEERIY